MGNENDQHWGRGHTLPMGTTPTVSQKPDEPLAPGRPMEFTGGGGPLLPHAGLVVLFLTPFGLGLGLRIAATTIWKEQFPSWLSGDGSAWIAALSLAVPVGVLVFMGGFLKSKRSHRLGPLGRSVGTIARLGMGALVSLFVTVCVIGIVTTVCFGPPAWEQMLSLFPNDGARMLFVASGTLLGAGRFIYTL